ncbi:sigma-70 family RNA polymerase sigma factor [Paenibacillus lautus]|uniref:RNA polymerase sigma factor n=1 Tax=Paenibacillus lautus TaxID=1401 RepID=UPI003D27F645
MKQWYYLLRTPIVKLDVAAQQLVYRSFYKLVYSDVYFIIRDHFLTEDIIQEAFLKAAKKAPALRSESNIPGWLRQVARRTALDKLRKYKKDRQMLASADVFIEESTWEEISISCEVEIKIRNESLHRAMEELTTDYRLVLHKYYIEGNTYKEICQELNLTESALTHKLARARKKLLVYFLRIWVDADE